MQRMVTRLDDQLNLLREENQALHDQVAAFKAGKELKESTEGVNGVANNTKNNNTSSPSSTTVPDSSEIKRELESLTLKVADLKTTKEKLLAEKEAEIAQLKENLEESRRGLREAEVEAQRTLDEVMEQQRAERQAAVEVF